MLNREEMREYMRKRRGGRKKVCPDCLSKEEVIKMLKSELGILKAEILKINPQYVGEKASNNKVVHSDNCKCFICQERKRNDT